MEYHLQQLPKHCRVCGKKLFKTKGRSVTYNCEQYKAELTATFSIEISQDCSEQHPPQFCQSCYCGMKRATKATSEGSPYCSSIVVYEWTKHTPECSVRIHRSMDHILYLLTCPQVCNHFMMLAKGGGQNKKKCMNRGRRADAYHAVLLHLDTIAPPSFFPDDNIPTYKATAVSSDLACPICAAILERPIQLACGSIVCLGCCRKWINSSISPLSCPCCYNHQLNCSTIHSPPTVVMSLLSSLLVNCGKECQKTVRADLYRKHLNSKCQGHYHLAVNSPSKMTLRDVLEKPAKLPPTPAETRVAEHLFRRLLDSSDEQVIRVPTSGQVGMMYILQACKVTCMTNTLYLIASHISTCHQLPCHQFSRQQEDPPETNITDSPSPFNH